MAELLIASTFELQQCRFSTRLSTVVASGPRRVALIIHNSVHNAVCRLRKLTRTVIAVSITQHEEKRSNMLVSGRVRSHFRQAATDVNVASIERFWESEGFVRGEPGASVDSSERRREWRAFEAGVDWSSEAQVARVMRVYESVVAASGEDRRAEHEAVLSLDGWRLSDRGTIVLAGAAVPGFRGLVALRDRGGIEDAFARVTMSMGVNPAGCIGASKELIEATAKTVLTEVGDSWTERDDVHELVARVQKRLGLHPTSISSTQRDDAIAVASKRILGGLSAIALGVSDLRNHGGSGHGRVGSPIVSERHARLAVGAAHTWCELVLATYSDPSAPWKRAA